MENSNQEIFKILKHSIKASLAFAAFSILMILFSCNHEDVVKKPGNQAAPARSSRQAAKTVTRTKIVVEVIPFGTFPGSMTTYIVNKLRLNFPEVIQHENRAFPAWAYYKPRNRYKADSLIDYLKTVIPSGHVAVGLSDKDISTTSGNYEDWGIFGLGEWPGRACVVSTFRLDKEELPEQLFKVVIHELGHTAGLDHCIENTCLMRDAEGKNTTDNEHDFCKNCRKKLIDKGWTLK